MARTDGRPCLLAHSTFVPRAVFPPSPSYLPEAPNTRTAFVLQRCRSS